MKKRRKVRRKFKAFACSCGGEVKLRKDTGYVTDGSAYIVSDSLALPQCGTCREVFLTPSFEKKIEKDMQLTPGER